MKKGGKILLCICAAALCFLTGMLVGRNLKHAYKVLPENTASEAMEILESDNDFRLDINTATKLQLMDLEGIGEGLAERILAYRDENGPFSTTDELLNVEGIGEKKLQAIVDWIKVGG